MMDRMDERKGDSVDLSRVQQQRFKILNTSMTYVRAALSIFLTYCTYEYVSLGFKKQLCEDPRSKHQHQSSRSLCSFLCNDKDRLATRYAIAASVIADELK